MTTYILCRDNHMEFLDRWYWLSARYLKEVKERSHDRLTPFASFEAKRLPPFLPRPWTDTNGRTEWDQFHNPNEGEGWELT